MITHERSLLRGEAAPLGATVSETGNQQGVNFAIWAGAASQVELCVFDSDSETRLLLPGCTNGVWHGFLPGATAGLAYGFRVHGAYEPTRGLRFNASKLLLDPYAREIRGQVVPDDRLRDGHLRNSTWQMDSRDSAPYVPRSIVRADHFDWQDTDRPGTRLCDSVIYEMHVKGFTQLHPAVPEELRGSYLGLAEPAVIEYLLRLGVTTIELLPCASFASEEALVRRGLVNYWGYNPIGFFAPHSAYSLADPVTEFQTMVRAMHQAGIEVIMDVVYNHTAEGGSNGSTLSFRGIANNVYYQLRQNDPSAYVNNTGCGNTFAADNPVGLRLILDSLRYWVEVLGVDGFRFDLATTLARVNGEYDAAAPFLQAVFQDPVLSRCKLIAEPWDVGHAGYRLGGFPAGWSEWNDRYRHTMRAFWRGEPGKTGEFASRLAGSEDIFASRAPVASINYISAHDGFTLHDLVSYRSRHNEANGENNADGDRADDSWNHGIEGPAADRNINARRERDKRALLSTLLLSQGVPMLLAGDEMGRTQQGNNNAYCQDNEVSWIDWASADQSLIEFVGNLTRLRREHGVLRRQVSLAGNLAPEIHLHDVQWFTHKGTLMQSADWQDATAQELSIVLHGDLSSENISPQQRMDSDDLLILVNGSERAAEFVLPRETGPWQVAVSSLEGRFNTPESFLMQPKSVVVFSSDNN